MHRDGLDASGEGEHMPVEQADRGHGGTSDAPAGGPSFHPGHLAYHAPGSLMLTLGTPHTSSPPFGKVWAFK